MQLLQRATWRELQWDYKIPLMRPLLRGKVTFQEFGVLRLGAAFAASDLARASLGLQLSSPNTTNGAFAEVLERFAAFFEDKEWPTTLQIIEKFPGVSARAALVVFGNDICSPREARAKSLAAKAAPSRSTPNYRKVLWNHSKDHISVASNGMWIQQL